MRAETNLLKIFTKSVPRKKNTLLASSRKGSKCALPIWLRSVANRPTGTFDLFVLTTLFGCRLDVTSHDHPNRDVARRLS